MSDKTAPIAVTCEECGCIRQVRVAAVIQDMDPKATTRFTYLETVCQACSNVTQSMVLLGPGWSVADNDIQGITCPCGHAQFRVVSSGKEHIEHGITVEFHAVVCGACGREGIVFIFSGQNVLPDEEREELLAMRREP